jgi:hypothetical protein
MRFRQWFLHGQDHVRIHGGEIASLKGLQGAHGYQRMAIIPDGTSARS